MQLMAIIKSVSSSIQNHDMCKAQALYRLAAAQARRVPPSLQERETLEFLRGFLFDEHGNEIDFFYR